MIFRLYLVNTIYNIIVFFFCLNMDSYFSINTWLNKLIKINIIFFKCNPSWKHLPHLPLETQKWRKAGSRKIHSKNIFNMHAWWPVVSPPFAWFSVYCEILLVGPGPRSGPGWMVRLDSCPAPCLSPCNYTGQLLGLCFVFAFFSKLISSHSRLPCLHILASRRRIKARA